LIDYVNGKFPEKIWVKIREKWSRILLPQAFATSQLLFKGINVNENKKLTFVLDVLSLDNNSYIIEVVDKYLNQSSEYMEFSVMLKIMDVFQILQMNQADDILKIVLKIMKNYKNADNIIELSRKIEKTVMKFAHIGEIRLRFANNLKDIESKEWLPLKNKLLNWFKSLDD
jgi:hypothetical protein